MFGMAVMIASLAMMIHAITRPIMVGVMFTIKGVKIMAASKKDAIKKYNHRKK